MLSRNQSGDLKFEMEDAEGSVDIYVAKPLHGEKWTVIQTGLQGGKVLIKETSKGKYDAVVVESDEEVDKSSEEER